ncbi:MAG TPA: cytochrome c [Edaphobacter sp.]
MLKPLFVPLTFSLLMFVPQQSADTQATAAIPADAAKMTNPVKATPESQGRAKKQYGYDCQLCHGPNGNGKGDVVNDLKLTLKDYTKPDALKDMTDGEIFYVITKGKGQMPGEGDRMKPDEAWNMVILVRSFSKGGGGGDESKEAPK